MQTATRSQSKPALVTVTGGDIGMLAKSFRRSLDAANRSPDTIRIYTISVAQLATFLEARGCPASAAAHRPGQRWDALRRDGPDPLDRAPDPISDVDLSALSDAGAVGGQLPAPQAAPASAPAVSGVA
jgi:hypothetical protein